VRRHRRQAQRHRNHRANAPTLNCEDLAGLPPPS
jgi:hypothetical protein